MQPTPEKPFQIEDLAAPTKVEEKPPHAPSRQEVGRARRAFITVQHPDVVECGHKLDQRRVPHGNCFSCWYAYFKTAVDVAKLHDELTAVGIEGLKNEYGIKYVKQFQRFLAYELSLSTPEQEPVSETSVQIEKGPFGIPETTGGAPAA
jgi:hypothetical protein